MARRAFREIARSAERRHLREKLLVHPRGGIRCIGFGECGDSLHPEFFALRARGFRNPVGK